MERTLKQLFDFQKFEDNASLRRVIDSVHSRNEVRELDLEDMNWVNAAGVSAVYRDKKPDEEP